MNILFIGLGSIGQRHLRNLLSIKKKNIKIFYYSQKNKNLLISKNLKSAKKTNFKKKFGITKISHIEDIKKIKPNISFVCNPSSNHIDFSMFLANLGSHIFLEKPLSNNFKNLKKLKEIIIKKKLIFYVGYQMKFHPLLIKVKKIIDEKTYGNLLSIKSNFGEYLEYFHRYENIKDTIYGKKKYGGGVILEISHEIDYLLWLVGRKPKKIKSLFSKLSQLPINVEDICLSVMTFEKYNKNILVSLNLDLLQFDSERNLTLIFEKSIIRINLTNNVLKITEKNGKKRTINLKKFERNYLFVSQLKYFLKCIKLNKQPIINNFESAFETLKFSLEMKKQSNLIK